MRTVTCTDGKLDITGEVVDTDYVIVLNTRPQQPDMFAPARAEMTGAMFNYLAKVRERPKSSMSILEQFMQRNEACRKC